MEQDLEQILSEARAEGLSPELEAEVRSLVASGELKPLGVQSYIDIGRRSPPRLTLVGGAS